MKDAPVGVLVVAGAARAVERATKHGGQNGAALRGQERRDVLSLPSRVDGLGVGAFDIPHAELAVIERDQAPRQVGQHQPKALASLHAPRLGGDEIAEVLRGAVHGTSAPSISRSARPIART